MYAFVVAAADNDERAEPRRHNLSPRLCRQRYRSRGIVLPPLVAVIKKLPRVAQGERRRAVFSTDNRLRPGVFKLYHALGLHEREDGVVAVYPYVCHAQDGNSPTLVYHHLKLGRVGDTGYVVTPQDTGRNGDGARLGVKGLDGIHLHRAGVRREVEFRAVGPKASRI